MAKLPSMKDVKSFNTKDIMIMLSRAILAEDMPTDDQNKIPIDYIALFAKDDYFYAQSREQAKNPEDLIRAIATASAIRENVSKNTKAKTEYKLYLEQLESGIRKAEEQLTEQKKLAKIFDEKLPTWHEKHRENVRKLTRTGVSIDSAVMESPIRDAFKEGDVLIKKAKDVKLLSDTVKEGLLGTITATKAVVPKEFIEAAASQAETAKKPGPGSAPPSSFIPE